MGLGMRVHVLGEIHASWVVWGAYSSNFEAWVHACVSQQTLCAQLRL